MLQPAESSHAAAPWTNWRAYWRQLAAEVRSDRLIYAIVAVYALSAWALSLVIGHPEKLVLGQYFAIWLDGLALVAGLYLVLFELPPSISANRAAPLAALRERLPELLKPRTAAAFILLLSLALLMGAFTSVKNMLSDISTFHSDVALADLDRLIHAGRDPWTLIHPLMGHHLVTRTIQVLYAAGWMMALLIVPAMVATSRRLEPLRRRFFLTYAFCWIVLGNVLAGMFLSAGPVYFGAVSGDFARFAPQLEYLSFSAGRLHSSFDIQRDLWVLHARGVAELGSGISAFPSMHVAMATLYFLLGCSVGRAAGIAGAVFLAVVLAGSVHLAWHYAIDGYASIAVTMAAWFAIAAWEKARRAPAAV